MAMLLGLRFFWDAESSVHLFKLVSCESFEDLALAKWVFFSFTDLFNLFLLFALLVSSLKYPHYLWIWELLQTVRLRFDFYFLLERTTLIIPSIRFQISYLFDAFDIQLSFTPRPESAAWILWLRGSFKFMRNRRVDSVIELAWFQCSKRKELLSWEMLREINLSAGTLIIPVTTFLLKTRTSGGCAILVVRVLVFHESAYFRLSTTALAPPTVAFFDFEKYDQRNVNEVNHSNETYQKPSVEVFSGRLRRHLNRDVERVDRKQEEFVHYAHFILQLRLIRPHLNKHVKLKYIGWHL